VLNDSDTENTALTIRLHRLHAPVTVLGPFARAGVWVQGCPFRCEGCITQESLDFAGGFEKRVDEVAAWILDKAHTCAARASASEDTRDACEETSESIPPALPLIEGVTFSGGEPFAQPDACAEIVELVRRRSDLGVVCYTGHTHEELQAKKGAKIRRLLALVDLLIDGCYEAKLHADLLWRGSSNQRILNLTDRYRAETARILAEHGDRSAGIEITFDADGKVQVTGVPPIPDFRAKLSLHGTLGKDTQG
jgi:anaerobic ribonucleoside-triphosphate reductase activating protein